MRVKVLLKGYLVRYFDGEKERIMEFEEGFCIRDAVKIIGLDPESKKFGFAAVNGKRCGVEQFLNDGDELKIYPRMSGG